jgi:hypothetical protein
MNMEEEMIRADWWDDVELKAIMRAFAPLAEAHAKGREDSSKPNPAKGRELLAHWRTIKPTRS